MLHASLGSPFMLAVFCAVGATVALDGTGVAGPARQLNQFGTAADGAAARWTTTATSRALVRLPPHSVEVALVEERRSNQSLTQRISLKGTQQDPNFIVIEVQSGSFRRETVSGKPTESGIRDELAAAFPGLKTRVLTQPRYNAYGPYGLATTQGARTCVYAWQWLDVVDRTLARKLGGPAAWRARICRDGVSFEAIGDDLDRIDFGVAEQRTPPARKRPTPKRVRPPAHASAPAVLPPAPAYGAGQQHYLAPAPIGAPTAGSPTLDPSLPAEAYRGPSR